MAKRTQKSRPKPAKRGPGRPRTTGRGVLVACRCHPPFLDAVDRWRGKSDLSRPAAIMKLAEMTLKSEGEL